LDGKYIVSGSEDKSIKIFDLETKQEVHHFADIHEGKNFYSKKLLIESDRYCLLSLLLLNVFLIIKIELYLERKVS